MRVVRMKQSALTEWAKGEGSAGRSPPLSALPEAQGLEGLLGDASGGAGATGRVAADGAGRIAIAAARSQSCLQPIFGGGGGFGGGAFGGNGGGFSGRLGSGVLGSNGGSLEALSHAPTA